MCGHIPCCVTRAILWQFSVSQRPYCDILVTRAIFAWLLWQMASVIVWLLRQFTHKPQSPIHRSWEELWISDICKWNPVFCIRKRVRYKTSVSKNRPEVPRSTSKLFTWCWKVCQTLSINLEIQISFVILLCLCNVNVFGFLYHLFASGGYWRQHPRTRNALNFDFQLWTIYFSKFYWETETSKRLLDLRRLKHIKQIELPAKPLNYFMCSNESNINQSVQIEPTDTSVSSLSTISSFRSMALAAFTHKPHSSTHRGALH